MFIHASRAASRCHCTMITWPLHNDSLPTAQKACSFMRPGLQAGATAQQLPGHCTMITCPLHSHNMHIT
jgi:hypothetical protein